MKPFARNKTVNNLKRKLREGVYDTGNFLLSTLGNRKNTEIINSKEIRFSGLQRSGNHAIINWIYKQSEAPVCFLNCVRVGSNPFLSFKRKSTVREFQKDFYNVYNIPRERLGFLSRKGTLIYSYEDDNIEEVFNCERFEKNHDRWIGKSAKRFNVLILRDPFNLFASRLKKEESFSVNRYSLKNPEERKIVIGMWKSYAREILGITNIIKENKVLIVYDKWFADASYRAEIAGKLELEFNDSGFNEVIAIGGGSSFDRTNLNNSATEMKVLERWKFYENSKEFAELFKDDELIEMSEKIFGKIPGTENFKVCS